MLICVAALTKTRFFKCLCIIHLFSCMSLSLIEFCRYFVLLYLCRTFLYSNFWIFISNWQMWVPTVRHKYCTSGLKYGRSASGPKKIGTRHLKSVFIWFFIFNYSYLNFWNNSYFHCVVSALLMYCDLF